MLARFWIVADQHLRNTEHVERCGSALLIPKPLADDGTGFQRRAAPGKFTPEPRKPAYPIMGVTPAALLGSGGALDQRREPADPLAVTPAQLAESADCR